MEVARIDVLRIEVCWKFDSVNRLKGMGMAEDAKQRELHPSEIAKIDAETAKVNAEAEAAKLTAEAEAEHARAEARLFTAQAQQEELSLVKAKHEADREEHKRAKELAADEHHLVYHFNGAVDAASVDKCLAQLATWKRTHDKPGKIDLYFFSPGGGVMAGMALFDEIQVMRAEGWHFTTLTRGYAASMGGILLQAGDVRTCGPESYILIHEISSGAVGKIGDLEDEVEFVKLIQRRVNDLFVKRSNGKVTSAKLRAMYRRKDFWLDSEKALALGIVDEIR